MIAKKNDDSFAVLILLLLLIPLMWLYYNQKLENSQSRHNKKSGKVYQEGPQNHYSKRKGGKRRKTKSKAKVRHPKNSADQNGDASTNSSILDMLWGRRRGVEEEKDNVNEDDEQKMPSVSFVAMDCEMVGIGRQGINSMLARCSIVSVDEEFILEESKNEDCDDEDDCNCDENDLKKSPMKMPRIKVLYDVYVKPTKHVTDYRTEYSGITPEHFERDDAVTYEVCRSKVLSMLNSTEDRVVVLIGHALKNDFQVLRYWHPSSLVRDTAYYKPFMRPVRKRFFPKKLSFLAEEHLGVKIQNNSRTFDIDFGDENLNRADEHYEGHSSIEDAAAALLLYKKFHKRWEEKLDFPLHQRRET